VQLYQPATAWSIDAIDDSDTFLILKTDLDKLYLAVPKLERLFPSWLKIPLLLISIG
jgi:hypothetical protein